MRGGVVVHRLPPRAEAAVAGADRCASGPVECGLPIGQLPIERLDAGQGGIHPPPSGTEHLVGRTSFRPAAGDAGDLGLRAFRCGVIFTAGHDQCFVDIAACLGEGSFQCRTGGA